MLNISNVDNLIIAEEENFLSDVIAGEISEMSSAEAELTDICNTDELNELKGYLSERGIEYWLSEPVKANPVKKYRVWISRTRGNHPHWGLTPINKAEPQPHERKHRS